MNDLFPDDESDHEINEFYDDEERDAQNAHGIVGDEDDYGACPLCGSAGEAVAQGRHHWLVCHADRVKWRIGTGLFGSGLLGWITRGRQNWDRAGDWLDEYREVAPSNSSAAPQSITPHLSLLPGTVARDAENEDDEEIARLKRMFE